MKHKPCIENKELRCLKESAVMSPSTPQGLLNNVWFHITLYFCCQGREGQRNLSENTISFQKLGRMYQTEHPDDKYALRLQLEKLNPECSAFFQYPKRSWKRPQEGVWFENRCLGVNKLGDMMKILSKAANLSKIYTNHSVRATAITLWSDAGLSNRHIMSLSGHRNENSLRSYNTRPSSQQLQLCSNVLSTALNSADQHLLPQKVTQQPDLTSGIATCTIPTQNIYSRHDEKVSFATMFSGCQIGQVPIHRHDKPQ